MKRRTVTVSSEQKLIKALVPGVVSDESEAARLLTRGAVYVNGKRAKHDVLVQPGQILSAVLEESGREAKHKSLKFEIEVLFEDADVLVLNKPSGQVAQPTPGRVGESLIDTATTHLKHEAGLVHRLDRETSGVTIFGKHAKATAALAEAFRLGEAKKRYLAVTVAGLKAKGVIDLPLSKDPSRPGRWRASKQANGISAVTNFERLFDGEYALVSLFPQTGRTHQLRAHLAGLGHPILGDTLYGGPGDMRCLLHAQSLRVLGRTFHAPVPDDVRVYFEKSGTAVPEGEW